MKKASLSFFFLTFLTFIGLSQSEEVMKQVDTSQWKTFSEGSFSIKYPEDWELQSPGQMGTTFILFSPIRDEQDQFRENINLMVQDLGGYQFSLDQYVEASKEQIQALITGAKLVISERWVLNGKSVHKMIFYGKQGAFDLKFEQHYRIVDDKAYVLTLTCNADEFEDYVEIGEKMLESFAIRPSEKE